MLSKSTDTRRKLLPDELKSKAKEFHVLIHEYPLLNLGQTPILWSDASPPFKNPEYHVKNKVKSQTNRGKRI